MRGSEKCFVVIVAILLPLSQVSLVSRASCVVSVREQLNEKKFRLEVVCWRSALRVAFLLAFRFFTVFQVVPIAVSLFVGQSTVEV